MDSTCVVAVHAAHAEGVVSWMRPKTAFSLQIGGGVPASTGCAADSLDVLAVCTYNLADVATRDPGCSPDAHPSGEPSLDDIVEQRGSQAA